MIFACAGYLLFRWPQDKVIAHVGDEHVKVGVAIVVAKGEAHPRAYGVQSHFGGHGREGRVAGSGVVAVHVEPIAIVGYP